MVASTRSGRAVHLLLKKASPKKVQLKVKKGKDAKSPKKKTTAKQPRRTKAAPASAQASDGQVVEGANLDELAMAAAGDGAAASSGKETGKKRKVRTPSSWLEVARVKFKGNYELPLTKLK
eukprot:CAMPEP_0198711002 /NCGR_PEP_ID=MMETSP1471-20131121/3183_1 /TAXON_ID=41880 /ORGANISM="Pycnococcus provasolii, Strain RCC733" /LENGTH=120 /DNA_ID=CAMNT_0044470751 /DNA_START=17 /DNA_END=376 /DNA_ORIENTATION=-